MKMWTVVEFLSWFNSEKSNPIRQVVLKSSSLVQQSSQLPGEKPHSGVSTRNIQ